jgi:nucleoside-diphosphate kinase
MSKQLTFGIVKPNATAKNVIGGVIGLAEKGGLKVRAMKMLRLTRAQAEGFYAVHRERPFFSELVEFMTSGPVVVMALEGENAVTRWREIMGATDPAKADAGTVRALFGESIQNNAAHGSDSDENAKIEVAFFFSTAELASLG